MHTTFFVHSFFFGIPMLSIGLFILGLIRFLLAKRKNRKNPGSIATKILRRRLTFLIVTSVVASVLVAIFWDVFCCC